MYHFTTAIDHLEKAQKKGKLPVKIGPKGGRYVEINGKKYHIGKFKNVHQMGKTALKGLKEDLKTVIDYGEANNHDTGLVSDVHDFVGDVIDNTDTSDKGKAVMTPEHNTTHRKLSSRFETEHPAAPKEAPEKITEPKEEKKVEPKGQMDLDLDKSEDPNDEPKEKTPEEQEEEQALEGLSGDEKKDAKEQMKEDKAMNKSYFDEAIGHLEVLEKAQGDDHSAGYHAHMGSSEHARSHHYEAAKHESRTYSLWFNEMEKSEEGEIMDYFDEAIDHLEKAEKKGEGSRGGKVIGHTSSGKPIYANILEKAGKGAGSRGGHVIGRTRSGKPIYRSSHEQVATSKTWKEWSKQDHADAAKAHKKEGDAAYKRFHDKHGDAQISTFDRTLGHFHRNLEDFHNMASKGKGDHYFFEGAEGNSEAYLGSLQKLDKKKFKSHFVEPKVKKSERPTGDDFIKSRNEDPMASMPNIQVPSGMEFGEDFQDEICKSMQDDYPGFNYHAMPKDSSAVDEKRPNHDLFKINDPNPKCENCQQYAGNLSACRAGMIPESCGDYFRPVTNMVLDQAGFEGAGGLPSWWTDIQSKVSEANTTFKSEMANDNLEVKIITCPYHNMLRKSQMHGTVEPEELDQEYPCTCGKKCTQE